MKMIPAVPVFRQRHQLHGNLRTSSCGKHSRASFSALPTRLPGEGARQRQHPPRIQQRKRTLLPCCRAICYSQTLAELKNTLVLYQAQNTQVSSRTAVMSWAWQLWLSLWLRMSCRCLQNQTQYFVLLSTHIYPLFMPHFLTIDIFSSTNLI